jgi:hypothetical protein
MVPDDENIEDLRAKVEANYRAYQRVADENMALLTALEGLLERFSCDSPLDDCVAAHADAVIKKVYATRRGG